MTNLWKKISITATATLWTVSAVAQTTATIPSQAVSTTSQTAVEAAPKSKKLPISVVVDSTYYGSTITDLNNDVIPDDSIDSTTGSYLRNKIGMGFNISKNVRITPFMDFEYQLGDPDPSQTRHFQFRWKDAYVTISHNDLLTKQIGKSELGISGDIRVFAPTSLGAREADTIGAIRGTLNQSLSLGTSRFSLSNQVLAKFWAQTRKDNPLTQRGLPQWEMYAGPQLNLKANDNVSLFVLYEAILHFNTFGQSDVANYAVSNTDLEPGANIQLNDNISISPFLNWYTNQSITTTSFNLNANIRLL